MNRTGSSSMASGTSSGGMTAPRSALACTVMSASGSGPASASGVTCMRAPISRSMSSSPVRVGLMPTPRTVRPSVAPRHPATMKNAAEEKSPGTRMSVPRRADRRRARPWRPARRTLHAEAAEHALGVIAGGRRLGDAGDPACLEAGQQDRGFDLRTRHRQRVVDAVQRSRRRAAPPAAGPPACRCARPSGAAAWPRAPSAAASARHRRSACWKNSGRTAAPWTVAWRCRRCPCRAAQALARSPAWPAPVTITSSPRGCVICTPSERSAAMVARQSPLSRKPLTRVWPSAIPPSISARCEIDLSPGTMRAPPTRLTGATRKPRQRSGVHGARRNCPSSASSRSFCPGRPMEMRNCSASP